MTLRDYIDSLSADQLEAYAKRCGTTANYLKVKVKYRRCEPRRALREALSRESNGLVSEDDVLIHFGLKASPDKAA